MSRANGWVYVDGDPEPRGYCVYDGTTDMMLPGVFDTEQQAWDDYQRGREAMTYNWPTCSCGGAPQPCRLKSDYGSGTAWGARWCPTCRVVVDGLSPYGDV